MADLKISALPASTVPLAGSEVLPIVQSSSTKQVSVGNLTAGRAVSASSFSAPAFKTPANNQTIINSIGATGVNYLQISDQVTGGNPNMVAYGTDANVGMNFATQGTGDFKFFSGNVTVGSAGKSFSLPGGITWTSGSGSPEAAVTAPVGSLYSRSDGGLLTSLYVKESGAGNTGWVGK